MFCASESRQRRGGGQRKIMGGRPYRKFAQVECGLRSPARIKAYEPHPANFKRLTDHVHMNGVNDLAKVANQQIDEQISFMGCSCGFKVLHYPALWLSSDRSYTRREGETGRREVAARQKSTHHKTVFLYSFLFRGPAS